MTESVSFWQSWFMWRDAIIVAALCAAALSYLGVWIVLKRVVYVPLALSQVSSVGVVVAFFICSLLEGHRTSALFDPAWMSLVFGLVPAFYFAHPKGEGSNATVVAYLVSAASALLLAGFVRQDLHDVDSVLFGSAVLVETIQIVYVGLAVLALGLVHVFYYRRFLFISFDPTSAGASGLRVYRHEVLLYVTFAIMISVSTRAIGALPAFGFTVLPALAALNLATTMRATFVLATLIGTLSAVLGYYLSFVWELPTGATMVGVAGLAYVATAWIPTRSRRAETYVVPVDSSQNCARNAS